MLITKIELILQDKLHQIIREYTEQHPKETEYLKYLLDNERPLSFNIPPEVYTNWYKYLKSINIKQEKNKKYGDFLKFVRVYDPAAYWRNQYEQYLRIPKDVAFKLLILK